MLRRICFFTGLFLLESTPICFFSGDYGQEVDRARERLSKQMLPEGSRYILGRDFVGLLNYFAKEKFRNLYGNPPKGTLEEVESVMENLRSIFMKINKNVLSENTIYVFAFWLLRPSAGVDEPSALFHIGIILNQTMRDDELRSLRNICLKLCDELEPLKLRYSLLTLFSQRCSVLSDAIDVVIAQREFCASRGISPQPRISQAYSGSCPSTSATLEMPVQGACTLGISPEAGSPPR